MLPIITKLNGVFSTSSVSSLLVYRPFISEQDSLNLLSKRAEPFANR